MRNFQYNFALLKKTREDRKISKLEMAHQLCLSVNQINSIEEDNFRYFPRSEEHTSDSSHVSESRMPSSA